DDQGHIALYVDEADRSWCSSNAANDNRAVTIEVSSDDTAPYAVTAEAISSLIYLVADICKRNGIQKLRWFHDKNLVGKLDDKVEPVQNMTLHKWFANKACPGQYLEERMFEIAAKVNALL
ncbi:MAG: N-acetylmuramoyl-L-alanine amidase, partial [Fibrobacter sp.]|nr:N-acetylmuramoyl-L-alanine amidase [Fibrobacter sp.]